VNKVLQEAFEKVGWCVLSCIPGNEIGAVLVEAVAVLLVICRLVVADKSIREVCGLLVLLHAAFVQLVQIGGQLISVLGDRLVFGR